MKITKILMATTVLAFSAASVNAATQGTAGGTSSGTSSVTMDVIEEVKISGLQDFVPDNGSGGRPNTYEPNQGDVSQTQTFCMYYNNGTDVTLQIDSANTPDFRLTDGTEFIDYDVTIASEATATAVPHAEGVAVAYTFAAQQEDCVSTTSLPVLTVSIIDTFNALPVANGTYTDTMTYTLTPDP